MWIARAGHAVVDSVLSAELPSREALRLCKLGSNSWVAYGSVLILSTQSSYSVFAIANGANVIEYQLASDGADLKFRNTRTPSDCCNHHFYCRTPMQSYVRINGLCSLQSSAASTSPYQTSVCEIILRILRRL